MWDDIFDVAASAASTIGTVIESTTEAVADTVEEVVDEIADTAQGAVEASAEIAQDLDPTGGVLAAPVVLITGVVHGVIEIVEVAVGHLAEQSRHIGSIIGAVLSLDIARAIDHFVALLIDLLDFVLDVVRVLTLGYFVGAMVDMANRGSLRRFVKGLVEDRFGDDPLVLDAVKQRLGLHPGQVLRLRFPAVHRVFRIDSRVQDGRRSANGDVVPLWQLHNDGVIDLYAMAGVVSFASFQVFSRPATVVRYIDESGNDGFMPVNRWMIRQYLDSRGADIQLRVYSMSHHATIEKLRTAREKLRRIGIELIWNEALTFSRFFRVTTLDIEVAPETTNVVADNPVHQAYHYHLFESDEFLVEQSIRPESPPPDEDCTLQALGVFHYAVVRQLPSGNPVINGGREHYGYAPGRVGGSDSGLMVPNDDPAAATHRDVWPAYLSRYVLAHEIGHYFGLPHRNGIENIMFTPVTDSPVGSIGSLLLHYWLHDEPEFTLEDGKSAWTMIVDHLTPCVRG